MFVAMQKRMRYQITRLGNGFYRLYDYACQWDGLYNADGSFRHGNTSSIRHLNQISRNWKENA